MRRIGIDTGGTFTDGVLWDDETGVVGSTKVSSDRHDPSRAVINAVGKLTADMDVEHVRYLVHGTTVATNASLERTGPRVAVLCTVGFRDVLEIARLMRPPDQIYDLRADPPPPLVRRRDRIEIDERIDHTGAVVRPLNVASVRRAAEIIRARGIESLAICFLYSYLNPDHERRTRDILAEQLPSVNVSLSSDVLPEFREYERSSTTALNAYLAPVVSGYLRQLDAAVSRWNQNTRLWIMQSNGGVASVDRAAQAPVTLLLSGPSGGVVAGRHLAEQAGVRDAITIDMGGTSFDVCVLASNEVRMTQERKVLEMPVTIPSVDILTIGAGGGSIGWVDRAGQFRVGPHSAGAHPGPACYGRGGEEPTVTDANLVLGVLGEDQRLGGEVSLKLSLAHRACERLGHRLGVRGQEAAWGIRRIVNAAMAGAVHAVSVGQGFDPRDFTLIAFGGAGPMHALDIAEEIDIPTVLVPAVPGCHSALGMVVTDVTHDYVVTHLSPVEEGLRQRVEQIFKQQESTANDQLESEEIGVQQRQLFRGLDMRYVGEQSSVAVPVTKRGSGWLSAAVAGFHQLHDRLYGFQVPDEPVEVVNVRLRAVGRLHGERLATPTPLMAEERADPAGWRSVAFGPSESDRLKVPVYRRGDLRPGSEIEGPAVVEQDDSTLLVTPGKRAGCDAWYSLWLSA
ncbi:MAG: hydantoinase/oxoprolinase family protein [Candidatus Dormibacteraeota bacterium]|uniref:Hydantoinase/oxoprolinase family protein n=2 Tax=Candidatus Dormibacteria TaxID=3126996 RepID=A0A934JW47_9BACT|nr:hydantoinase/oxoprolinase family protein [Candidatus Dormibacteraeota bacterium]MBJ7603959.1 hydantoinase/oxoprolinase family protein [Candidatus Dormibacteraeota bacterium]MBJ7607162.1 hydantoinase/oxoprolinase family protein [Candidatus Dormibacteraeota bacterium]